METAALIREPLGLLVPDPLVETIWEETGGHPLLLQMLMERAVDLGPDPTARLHEVLHDDHIEQQLAATIFPIWWENLTPRGQSVYRS